MWIVKDEAMSKLLDGEFCEVIEALKNKKDLSKRKLYEFQFKYSTPQGFNRFFNHKLAPIKDEIDFVDDNSIIGKFLNKFIRK